MSDERAENLAWLQVAGARLAAHRAVLAAAAGALLVLDLILGGGGLAALLAFALVLAAALIVPLREEQRPLQERRESGARRMDTLPAVDLAAAVQDPLYIFDANGDVVYSNETASAAFGPVASGVPLQLKFRAPEMHDFIGRVMQGGGGPFVIDYAERVPIERAYRVSAMPIGRETGLFVLLFKDQSEARRIDRMRADFIANASHELRTPLASIAGFIETLRGPAREDPKARETFLQIMHDQTSRMARLIDDLLSLSRLEVKPYGRPGQKLDLVPLAAGVRDALAHLAKESGVTIELEAPETPVEVAGHQDELVQVLENLVENACKYGSSGGRVVISVAGGGRNRERTITVTDFGPGIAEEHIPRITERFYRVDVDTSRAQKGTGLGLAIVKHILTRHGARLSIRSKVGEGSSFTVHFPPPEG
jgi:two-component system, OmpR family, phosphate regulon sensor histidine kinase PhoR